MIPYECYVLAPQRTAKILWDFLDTVLPKRRNYLKVFPVPETALKPQHQFDKIEELVDFLEKNPKEAYGLYWDNVEPKTPFQAIVFFTVDGGMILGVAELGDQGEETLKALAKQTGATFGTIVTNERPVENVPDFITYCQNTKKTKLLNGNFIL